MNVHRAMKDLAESPDAVRSLARYLLALGSGDPPVVWTEWELDFLEGMATRDRPEPLSMRQREILTELRNSTERLSEVDGFTVRGLIEKGWEERFDLDDEDDVVFIENLKATGVRSLTRRQVGRLLRICRSLGLIDGHHGYAERKPALMPLES